MHTASACRPFFYLAHDGHQKILQNLKGSNQGSFLGPMKNVPTFDLYEIKYGKFKIDLLIVKKYGLKHISCSFEVVAARKT